MKLQILIVTAAALVSGCASYADELFPPEPMAAPAGMPAPAYLEPAASGDLFEIESSRLALSMSRNPEVLSFAQMLIADHTRMSEMLMTTARSEGLNPPPPRLLPHHQDMLARLRSFGPGGFDVAYKRAQIAAHQEALDLHRTYAQDGDIEALRAVASQAVPIIEGHLAHAQRLPEWSAPPPPMPSRAGERG